MTPHGHLAQFSDARALTRAVKQLRAHGYRRIEAFSPYAVEGVAERLAPPSSPIPRAMLAAGIVGGVGALAMQYVAAVIDYPINAGGRPAASWPAFAPAAIEVAILFAVVAGFAAFLAGCRLPALYHPVFNVAWFEEASRDGFLVLVLADDPKWDAHEVAEDIARLEPMRHAEVDA